MKSVGIPLFKSITLLLAVLLCGILAFAVPATATAGPAAARQESTTFADKAPFILVAGEITSGEAEGMLQLDRSLLTQHLQFFLQRFYPNTRDTTQAPHSYPASKGDCGLHTILIKGP
ncbi:hypothetical protein [Pontibacter flavimaris]|uniref:Uncharacterized protein n=1 Tax=Pontibacter flavimaris TaxID=1797110 RepID=A0A1Q5PD58_9BACT|nr:hypothetical protein [Pontibacter flavimaris]OKL40111.1 hypothetical protein A3841_17320 [Pontibacter flavimaris]